MQNTIKVSDCVEFKNELHQKLYKKSGVHTFNEYIQYINSKYSDKIEYSEKQNSICTMSGVGGCR